MSKRWRLELDYDGLNREEVDADARRLVLVHPELNGSYRVETSRSGKLDHYHVIFPRGEFPSFQEAYEVALESRCDKDWLALCKQYQVFGLETDASRRAQEAHETARILQNKPQKMIFSPWLLDLEPKTSLDARRIVKLCESINDPEWVYDTYVHIWTLKQHVLIGCRDEAQALRRQKWISEQGLDFAASIRQNTRP